MFIFISWVLVVLKSLFPFSMILFISFIYIFHTFWSRVINIVNFTWYCYISDIFMLISNWVLCKIFLRHKQNKRRWISNNYLLLIKNYQKTPAYRFSLLFISELFLHLSRSFSQLLLKLSLWRTITPWFLAFVSTKAKVIAPYFTEAKTKYIFVKCISLELQISSNTSKL